MIKKTIIVKGKTSIKNNKKKEENNIKKEMNNIIKLETSTNNDIKYIYHMADIHIRNDQSTRDSYDIVFKRLYDEIKSFGKHEESLIVICGDVFDNKTNIKPEAISMIKDFFYNLCSFTDCIVILGNHEKPASNKEAMDVLTPIITQNFNTKNKLHLLKDKYYEYNNILFGLTSLYDTDTTKFDFATDKIKISLAHTYIHGATLENGHEEHMVGRFNLQDFSTADYLFLGDIHKFQYLNKNKTAAYPSSLLQLSFGENIHDHGTIRWDLSNKTSEYLRIPNDFCYLTVKVDKDKIFDAYEKQNIPKNVRIKFIWNNVPKNKKTEIIDTYKNKYNIVELREVEELRGIKLNLYDSNKNKIVDQLKNISSTKALINNYIDQKEYSTDIKKTMKEYLEKILNEVEINNDSQERNFKLVSLQFNNLYVYGENNKINFDNLKKIVGLIAPNKYGKSSIIEIIIQSIWGENTKGVSNNDIINNNKTNYSTQVIACINEIKYKIIRKAKHITKYSSHVKEEVDLYRFDNNKEINISKDNKKETDNEILKIFGDYQDYLKTCIMTQNQPYNFIDMSQMEKKIFLNKLFRLDVFRDISKKANSIKTELTTIMNTNANSIKNYDLKQININLNNLTKELNNSDICIDKHEILLDNIKNELAINNHKYNGLLEIINSNNHVKLISQELYNKKKKLVEYTNNIEQIYKELSIYQEKIKSINKILSDYSDESFDIQLENNEKDRLILLIEKIKMEKIAIGKNDIDIDTIKKKIKNIKYTLDEFNNNKNIKLDQLEILKKQIIQTEPISALDVEMVEFYERSLLVKNNLEKENSDLIKKIEEYKNILIKLKDHRFNKDCDICMNNEITKQKISIENIIKDKEQNFEANNIEIANIDQIIITSKTKVQNYYLNIRHEQNNVLISSKINDITKEIDFLDKEVSLLNKDLNNYNLHKAEYYKIQQYIQYNNDLQNEIKCVCSEINLKNNVIMDFNKKYDCAKKDADMYNSKILQFNTELNNLEKAKYLLDNEINILEVNFQKQKDIENKYLELNELKNNIDDNNSKLRNYQKELRELKNNKNNIEASIFKLKNSCECYSQLNSKIEECDKKRLIYNNIISIFNKGGINDEILTKTIIPTLELTVNNILNCVEDYNIKIEYDDKQNFRLYKDNNSRKNNVVLNSGHERGIDNMVFRLAFCFINNYIKTNFFVIDEGFKHSDEEHKDNLKSLFEYIRSSFDWCLITTHDEYVKNNFDKQINIEKKLGESFIYFDK